MTTDDRFTYDAYDSAELAEIYDCVYADRQDHGFWAAVAADAADGGPILELGCGTGRVLVPLARAGHEIVGLDLSPDMLARCRHNLAAEPDEVRARVTLVQADMTSFELGRRFALVTAPFRGFQHLMGVEPQLACLARCHAHLQPGGRLVLDLFNPDPALLYAGGEADDEVPDEVVHCEGGRIIRWWGTVLEYGRAFQANQCEMTYEITEPGDEAPSRRVTEQFPIRYIWRYELEHLLARAGFRVVALYGGYDRAAFSNESEELIAIAEPLG